MRNACLATKKINIKFRLVLYYHDEIFISWIVPFSNIIRTLPVWTGDSVIANDPADLLISCIPPDDCIHYQYN